MLAPPDGRKYLDRYVAELAYREDFRRQDKGWLPRDMLGRALPPLSLAG